MDDVRLGRTLRSLRRRRRWTQRQLGAAAGVSQSQVSLVERGHVEAVSVRTIRRLFTALDARYEGMVTWRGGALDRLLDERHAGLVGAAASRLSQRGWSVEVEVTFSEFGERGSIDLLAWHAPTRSLAIVEVKTEIASVEETLRRHDVKLRLAPKPAAERFGWQAVNVGRILVVLESSTNRRRVERHAATLGRAYPTRGWAVHRWIRAPDAPIRGLVFLSISAPRGSGRQERR